MFNNGYGASVVNHYFAYGDSTHPYELAVITVDNGKNTGLCYDTPITNDVIGYNNEQMISNLLRKIKDLPARS